MKRKRLRLIALILFLVLCTVGGSFLWALFQVPDFYEQAMAEKIDLAVRKAEAKKFTQQTLQLVDDIKHRKHWAKEFTQLQVNSWFAEELDGRFKDLLPEGASEPRLVIRGGAILVGFRYSQSGWSGVVSFEVKPWVPEPNQLALEIRSIKAGLVPIPLDQVLKQIGSQFETRGWNVTWRENEGNDVMLVDFGTREKKKSLLERIVVLENKLQVFGKSPAASSKAK
ncbi:MAG: hypothetical protein Tsb009_39560 [Planctomycetaceae bacterium]